MKKTPILIEEHVVDYTVVNSIASNVDLKDVPCLFEDPLFNDLISQFVGIIKPAFEEHFDVKIKKVETPIFRNIPCNSNNELILLTPGIEEQTRGVFVETKKKWDFFFLLTISNMDDNHITPLSVSGSSIVFPTLHTKINLSSGSFICFPYDRRLINGVLSPTINHYIDCFIPIRTKEKYKYDYRNFDCDIKKYYSI
jgi:hypothetical protein